MEIIRERDKGEYREGEEERWVKGRRAGTNGRMGRGIECRRGGN